MVLVNNSGVIACISVTALLNNWLRMYNFLMAENDPLILKESSIIL